MPNDYTTEATRASGPDPDDSVPEWALDRIAALERLSRDLYHAAGEQRVPIGEEGNPGGTFVSPSRLTPKLERRVCELLNLDPPGFDPATEGP